MDKTWIIDKDIDTVSSELARFVDSEVDLVIKPIKVETNSILYGCYIPTIPRPTSIISGRILIKELGDGRTELQAMDFQAWTDPFIKSLIDSLSAGP